MIQHEIECDCGRFMGIAYGEMIAELKCSDSRCKKLKQVKIVTTDSKAELINFKFKEPTE